MVTEEGTEKIKLSSRQSEERDVWAMQHYPFEAGGKEYKLSELATVEKGQMPQEVAKENQQYRLCLQYKGSKTALVEVQFEPVERQEHADIGYRNHKDNRQRLFQRIEQDTCDKEDDGNHYQEQAILPVVLSTPRPVVTLRLFSAAFAAPGLCESLEHESNTYLPDGCFHYPGLYPFRPFHPTTSCNPPPGQYIPSEEVR